MKKKILYLDMDGVLVDFESGIAQLSEEKRKEYEGRYARCPGIFAKMKPMEGSLEAVEKLIPHYDVYILSSAGWGNASAWSDKYLWVEKHLPQLERKLILSSQKNLNCGDYLIDDMLRNGVADFQGEHIHFGAEDFPNWEAVLNYLL